MYNVKAKKFNKIICCQEPKLLSERPNKYENFMVNESFRMLEIGLSILGKTRLSFLFYIKPLIPQFGGRLPSLVW